MVGKIIFSYDKFGDLSVRDVLNIPFVLEEYFLIVNIKTIRGVRAITNLKGYKPIEILNPSVLLESEE